MEWEILLKIEEKNLTRAGVISATAVKGTVHEYQAVHRWTYITEYIYFNNL